MNKYEQAEANRQSILDYLHASPYRTTTDLAVHLGVDTERANRLIANMVRMGEAARYGKRGSLTFTAIATKTVSADDIYAKVEGGLPKARPKQSAGRYIHVPGDPLPNQGGQGAVRRSVTIRSCMD